VTPGTRARTALRFSGPLALVAVALLARVSNGGCADAPCIATKLSRAEASQLVMKVPEVVALLQAGGKVDALEWHPQTTYAHPGMFYYFVAQKSKLETLPLESAVIGYFAVNLYSARVVNFSTAAEVSGAALQLLQTRLRDTHCISAQLVRENEDIAP
jgi:hypothetical protein